MKKKYINVQPRVLFTDVRGSDVKKTELSNTDVSTYQYHLTGGSTDIPSGVTFSQSKFYVPGKIDVVRNQRNIPIDIAIKG